MVQDFVMQWNANNNKLEEYFRSTPQKEYRDYEDIVTKVFELCISGFDAEEMTVIDNSRFEGTQIFIIPAAVNQPGIKDYVFTHNFYGSCDGCDTLMGIHQYQKGLPSEKQVKEYMTLSLHLVQRLKWLEE